MLDLVSATSFYPGAKEVPMGITTLTTGVLQAPTGIREHSLSSEHRYELSDAERDRLFQQFRPLVQRLLRKYADTAERRNDLEGEIFCLFCELVNAFQPERGVPLKAYLVHQLNTSTYTTVRKYWRRERREISLENCDDSMPMDPTSDWDDQLLLNQVRSLLPEAISKLPTRQRQVVLWRYYEHLPFEEIAVRLEVQPATVRSLLRHGINALRRNFRETNVNL
ncbi:MAG: sigma-70 family RNA polymerase sigma factor [Armatimonas sp.]